MEQAAEKRGVSNSTTIDITTNTWVHPTMRALDTIARNNGWSRHHYFRNKNGGREIHSVFMREQWRVGIKWSHRKHGGGILSASITPGPGTKQRMPQEFGLSSRAFMWVGDLLYDIGQTTEEATSMTQQARLLGDHLVAGFDERTGKAIIVGRIGSVEGPTPDPDRPDIVSYTVTAQMFPDPIDTSATYETP